LAKDHQRQPFDPPPLPAISSLTTVGHIAAFMGIV
jgi:hypothetical protein